MKSKRTSLKFGFFLLLSSLLLMGCTTITVVNASGEETDAAVVWVREPDFYRGKNLWVLPGESETTFSAYGGRYSITVTDYILQQTTLMARRNDISRWITINQRDPEMVANLRNVLKVVNQQLADLEAQGITCVGYVPDWGSVNAVITWDYALGKYQLTCTVESSE